MPSSVPHWWLSPTTPISGSTTNYLHQEGRGSEPVSCSGESRFAPVANAHGNGTLMTSTLGSDLGKLIFHCQSDIQEELTREFVSPRMLNVPLRRRHASCVRPDSSLELRSSPAVHPGRRVSVETDRRSWQRV